MSVVCRNETLGFIPQETANSPVKNSESEDSAFITRERYIRPLRLLAIGIVSVGKFLALGMYGASEGIILAAGLGGMGSVFGAPARGIGAGLLGLVFMVIIAGVTRFIGGIIVAIVYNIVLGAMGVLKWTWKQRSEPFQLLPGKIRLRGRDVNSELAHCLVQPVMNRPLGLPYESDVS